MGLGKNLTVAAPEVLAEVGRRLDSADLGIRIQAIGIVSVARPDREDWWNRIFSISMGDDVRLKSVALRALGTWGSNPERAIPRLIAAFDDYQEFDPDEQYDGSHVVVCAALAAFGPAAAPAVPALIARLERGPGDIDGGVVRTLTAIGPAARAALPDLRARLDPEADGDNPVFRAIAAITS